MHSHYHVDAAVGHLGVGQAAGPVHGAACQPGSSARRWQKKSRGGSRRPGVAAARFWLPAHQVFPPADWSAGKLRHSDRAVPERICRAPDRHVQQTGRHRTADPGSWKESDASD
ncbi:hypothetical protein B565_3791 [Aeromonas veronii B565]|nr:hypothetical protein B565_3791 [Aeromonas veronii B565]